MITHRLSKFWLSSIAAAVVAAAVGITASFIRVQAQAAAGESIAATYSHGVLRVTIPHHAPHAGAGRLSIELLDPEDHVVERSERRVDVTGEKGFWQDELKLSKALGNDDLVWHRVRYRFAYAGQSGVAIEGTESISQILRTAVMHILGQQSYLTGGQAGVRVIVTDSKNEIIPGSSSLRIELLTPDGKPQSLFSGRLNGRGTTEAQFRFPAGLIGSYPLRYTVDTPIGSTEFTQQVRLEDKVSILLTTEKPIYQPGQTIHVRALALDRSRREAAADRKLTFEVEDSRANKVFKKVTRTDKFGIASAEFGLADEVNLGAYHLKAVMDEAGSTSQIALNVERYVLPKFKVAVDFTGKAKHGYRPGDHVTGTVRANYFFGKPVDRAEIAIKASGVDVTVTELASVQGKTDADGAYQFDLRLPNYFAGRPLEGGAARVLIEATVKDAAGHSETRGAPITVSESPLIVKAIPEGGALIPNLENQLYIVASYPDGQPAQADVKVQTAGNFDQSATTDAGGVAIVRLNIGAGNATVKIEASDREGNRASSSQLLSIRPGEDQILLRTERAVYRAGDRIQLKVFSTKKQGFAYIDVVKDGQTVLTRDVELAGGQAQLSLTATAELAGVVDFSAYIFGRDARPAADHRLVFVQPADELKIEASADAPVYKPGDEARIRFRVTNAKGEGVQAALGLQVVDEAVFALAEKQPGFAKVFFYLEQEVMKPRYEIHSFGMPDIVQPVETSRVEQRDRAARALFSATEVVTANKFETEYGRSVSMTKFPEYSGRYRRTFEHQVRQASDRLTRAYLTKAAWPELRDAWGNRLRIERASWGPKTYITQSAGPDKRFNTGDDMAVYLEVRSKQVAGSGRLTINLNIEHDRGPFNGLAEIVGGIVDSAGSPISEAVVEVREVSSGKTRSSSTNDAGKFRLTGLPAGEYEIKLSSPGFRMASRKFTLNVRDRAVLSATLSVGSVTETVAFVPEVRQFEVGNLRGVVGGVPGGVAGGVMGGIFNRAASPAPAKFAEVGMRDNIAFNTGNFAKEQESASPATRVRSYFPEALYINPKIVTDQNGRATIAIPIADSITTWRMAMLASTTHGALGSGSSSIKVFQDFFVELDLPVTLTQGDRVSIPVAAYNYSEARGDVRLNLEPDDWFTLVEDQAQKTVAVDAGRVGGAQFTVQAKRIGKFKLTLSARLDGAARREDIVVREIEVIPDGREQNLVFNGRLENTVQHDLNFPAKSIPDAGKIFVRLYPGPLSQVIEGMDSILRMPGGCFEQTSSSTYPNVLALDYMTRTKKSSPEVKVKAEAYIANGYQRLLTFEVPGGGFSWFGSAPANKILTGYGLMEFFDMSKVHDVDPRLISRTQQWLASQQQADGSWKPDTSFINEGATNRYNSDLLRITAYLAWSLKNTGYTGPAIDKAKQFVEQRMNTKMDAYTLAVLANFAADYGRDREFTRRAMQLLLDARTEKDDQTWWTSEETGVYSTGASASVETTGLAVQALLKWGEGSGTARKALNYVASKKDASGAWGTTQATIMALRALLLATGKGTPEAGGSVEISLNGQTVEKLTLTPENNDLLHQFVLKGFDSQSANKVELRYMGKGGLAYQVVGRHFVPWTEKPAGEPLSIAVAYDRTTLAQDDIATATASIRNNLNKTANMVMVDLGIPPGFDLLSEDLQAYQEKTASRKGGRLEKFSLTATQAILYFDAIAPGAELKVPFRLRAKYPIRARTFASRVYEYYDPEVSSVARPVQLEIRKR